MRKLNLHDLTLIHYSAKPLSEVHDASQNDSRRDPYFKPSGLWVSAKGPDDWASWCESNSFRDIQTQIQNRIILASAANVLHLQNCYEIDVFTETYALTPRYIGDCSIDWPRVAEEFDGIVISPYQWQRRMTDHTFWYYGWDCASGCIWKARAVQCAIEERAIRQLVSP